MAKNESNPMNRREALLSGAACMVGPFAVVGKSGSMKTSDDGKHVTCEVPVQLLTPPPVPSDECCVLLARDGCLEWISLEDLLVELLTMPVDCNCTSTPHIDTKVSWLDLYDLPENPSAITK